MAELKPCPFCGGEAKLDRATHSSLVYCKECRASTKLIDFSPEYASDEKAIEAWNRRTANTPCDLCRFNPPSSGDGKPCTMCVAEGRAEDGK